MVKKITPRQKRALRDFYKAVDELKSAGIIRSDKYLGDIAEFLCNIALGVELAKSGRQAGHDGMIGESRVQIKYSGGLSNTVDCGNPNEYEILLIVIGPKSVLRRNGETGDYLVYHFEHDQHS
jgi:hypothetical protein